MPISSMHSTKYDGRLHYRYPVRLISESPDTLITYCACGTPLETYRGPRPSNHHFLSHFWRDKPYVLHVEWNAHWQPKFLYVDIADKVTWDANTVRYIDLDLDLILHHGATAIHLDDEDEFELHRKEWNYPDTLVKTCWNAVDTVRALLTAGNNPFNPSMFTWRPPSPIQANP
jgi:uncharacterized protein